jgi:hypothetical protein
MTTWVDFSHWGGADSVLVDPVELQAIDLGAQVLLDVHDAQVVLEMIDTWHCDLISATCTDPEWYTRALLCIALEGYLGLRAPVFVTDYASD